MRCVASMAENVSGWGLDLLWPTQVSEPRRIAILDSVAVTHTRPIGGPNYQHLHDRGGTALDELRQCLASHQIWNPVIRIEAVSTWGNFCLAGRSPLARMLLWGGRIVNIVHASALRYETCWQLRTKLRENRSSPLDEPDRLSTEQLRAFQNE